MLELCDIKKRYGEKTALNGISYTMETGVYGLLGPNGAGKSTLMNIMTDNLEPDQGTVLYEGEDIRRAGPAFRKLLGYAPQQQGLYDSFSGYRFLSYMGVLKGLSGKTLRREIEEKAEMVNLSDLLSKKLAGYSGGMKQRILIAQALMGSPQVIILDEPTAGLDPKERVRIRELLAKLGETATVITATHVVSDVESIAKEIIVLKNGQIITAGKPQQLVAHYDAAGSLEAVYMEIFGGEGAC